MILFQVPRPLLPPRAKTRWKLWVPQSFMKSWKRGKMHFFSRIPPRCGIIFNLFQPVFNILGAARTRNGCFMGPSKTPRGHFWWVQRGPNAPPQMWDTTLFNQCLTNLGQLGPSRNARFRGLPRLQDFYLVLRDPTPPPPPRCGVQFSLLFN